MRIRDDLEAFSKGKGLKKKISTILINPCFHAVALYRLSSILNKIHLVPLAKMVWYINRMLFHCDIDFRADLAGGFMLIHGLGTVIGRNARSTGILTIYQGVTVGGSGKERLYNGQIMDQPLLLNNVILYTDAKVFGPVIIGENIRVKAGKIITEDVME